MAYNGSKTGLSSPSSSQGASRFGRFLVFALIVILAIMVYYSWSLSIDNTELQERVTRYARDLKQLRNEKSSCESTIDSYKKRFQEFQQSAAAQQQDLKNKLTDADNREGQARLEAESCRSKAKISEERAKEDLDISIKEVADCNKKIDEAKTRCNEYLREEQLKVLNKVKQFGDVKLLQQLKDSGVDLTGVIIPEQQPVQPVRPQTLQQQGQQPGQQSSPQNQAARPSLNQPGQPVQLRGQQQFQPGQPRGFQQPGQQPVPQPGQQPGQPQVPQPEQKPDQQGEQPGQPQAPQPGQQPGQPQVPQPGQKEQKPDQQGQQPGQPQAPQPGQQPGQPQVPQPGQKPDQQGQQPGQPQAPQPGQQPGQPQVPQPEQKEQKPDQQGQQPVQPQAPQPGQQPGLQGQPQGQQGEQPATQAGPGVQPAGQQGKPAADGSLPSKDKTDEKLKATENTSTASVPAPATDQKKPDDKKKDGEGDNEDDYDDDVQPSKDDPAAAKLVEQLDGKAKDQQAPVGRSNIPAAVAGEKAKTAADSGKQQDGDDEDDEYIADAEPA